MKRMVGCDLLWLAAASCVLTLVSPSTTHQGYGSPRNRSNSDLDCGDPNSPSAGICFDPCQDHNTLNDPTRSTENTELSEDCDSHLRGWYRFVGVGGVKMPETCVSVFRCHTSAPMWLSGSHPLLGDGIVSLTACANWNENCCFWSSEVQVKTCSGESGEYYVYKLQGTPECSLRYCTEPSPPEPSPPEPSPSEPSPPEPSSPEPSSPGPSSPEPSSPGSSSPGPSSPGPSSPEPSPPLKECEITCRPEEECVFQNNIWTCVCRPDLNVVDARSLQPFLDCGDNEIKVKLDRCLLGGLGFKEQIIAYLNDRNCRGTMQDEPNNWVSMTSPVVANACGNILENNGTHAIYKNTLSLTTDFIIRDLLINVNFQCAYPLNMNASLQTALQPIVSSLYVNVDGAGEFNVKMALFQDQNYANPYEGTEVLLPVEALLYVGAFLNRGDTSRFKLLLTNCYATPSEDRNDPVKYFIIKNGCPNQRDSTVNVQENGVSSESRFSVQMFMFAGHYDQVFLHCEVYLCESIAGQCQPSCSTSRLRSSGPAIDYTRVLDLGPITKRSAQTSTSNGTPRTTGFLLAWPMVFLPVFLAWLF